MNFSKLVDTVVRVLRENGPEILTALGVVGVGTTAYYAAKAGYQTAQAMDEELKHAPLKEKIKNTWPIYMPTVIVGVGTATCIIYASKGNAKRTAAAVTAYSVTEKAFSDYRDKMVEQIGKGKDQKALDISAQDQVRRNPPPETGLIIVGSDEALCCELYTGRYFRSSMETLRKAQNDVNSWAITSRYVTLDDFYSLLGLPSTDVSGKLGWTDDELMDLVFSAVLTEDNRPCLAFRYNYVKPLQ